jgi:hypothetical protein
VFLHGARHARHFLGLRFGGSPTSASTRRHTACSGSGDKSPGRACRFVASAYRPAAADIEGLARNFAQALRYARATTETVVELDLVGADLPPLRPPEGYVVSTYLNGVPDHLQAQVGVLKGSWTRRGGAQRSAQLGSRLQSRGRPTRTRSRCGRARDAQRSNRSRSPPEASSPPGPVWWWQPTLQGQRRSRDAGPHPAPKVTSW